MEELVANFVIEEQPGINANLSLNVTNTEHDLLSHRDYPDQHPITAITGLQEALDTIPTDYVSDTELEAALLEKQDVIRDLSEIRQGATLGATAVQPSDLESYATIQYVDDGLSGKQDALVSGGNIKTINGQSVLGNGNLVITSVASWGNITGTLSAQTDLQNALNTKANVADIPTATSDLTNDSGFITLSALTGYATQTWVSQQGYLTEIPAEYVTDSELTAKGYQTAADVETAITAKGYTTMSAVEAKGYITNAALVGYATESYVTTAVGTETTNRQNADNNLQSQIDAITASSDVTDIVGTYAELQSYDTSALPPNSIIKVLQDESRNNETTYYRWVITGGVGAWSLIGEEGPYYTISAADAKFATQTALTTGLAAKQDTISDLATIRSGASAGATAVQPSDLATVATSGSYDDLSNKPTIPAAQVNSDWNATSGVAQILNKPSLATVATTGAYSDLSGTPSIPTVNNATLTITQGGVSKGTFTANASSDVTIALDAGGGGSSYTAGTGIDITNSVISVDGVTTSEVTLATVATTGDYSDLTGTSGVQVTSNLVTSVSSSSTDTQYPSAKCVYDIVGDVETLINAL